MKAKSCTRCGKTFPHTREYFHANGKYLRSWCKACANEKSREWASKNHDRHLATTAAWRERRREHVRACNRAWAQRNPRRSSSISRDGYLRRKYGLDHEAVEAMVSAQSGTCANSGCDAAIASRGMHSHIDHDHATGRIRGILCQRCNQALGLLAESPTRIAGLAEYIAR